MADKTSDQEPSIEEILASIRQIISDDDDSNTENAPEEIPAQTDEDDFTPVPVVETTPVKEPESVPEPVKEPPAPKAEPPAAPSPAPAPSKPEPAPAAPAPSEEEAAAAPEKAGESAQDDVLELNTPLEEAPPETQGANLGDAEIEVAMQDIRNAVEADPGEGNFDDEDGDEESDIMADDEDSLLTENARSAALASIAKLAANTPVYKSAAGGEAGVSLEEIVREMLHPLLKEWVNENLPPLVERVVQKELEKLARQAFDA